MQTTRLAVLGAALLGLCGATPAAAELVVLTSGRTLSVKDHLIDGERIVLHLRAGGSVTCDRSLIDRIEPDEVPYPEVEATAPAADPVDAAPAPVPYAELIENVAAAHGVDPDLVKAVVRVESGYRPRARSARGAMGLMQIMPATARKYDVRNPYDPKANLEAGVAHLAGLLSRFPVALALAAYNAGEAAVRRFGGVPPYRETRAYVRKILALVD